ncbi:hypothetical protein B0H17DRAFT_935259, partial [Mycena rosella]
YTPTARALARKLERHGCSQEFIGVGIKDVCNAAGMCVNKHMSQRTVGHSIGEGAVAAKIQIVDEMAHASSVSDSTSHRNQKYQGQHISMKALNYTDDSPAILRVHLLLVNSDTDNSSNTQVRGWLETITVYSNLYNCCPPLPGGDAFFPD